MPPRKYRNQSKEFRELQDEWYQKLKDSGFQDIEKTVDEEQKLKQRSSNVYRQAPEVVRENKENYFTYLGQHIHDEGCDSPVDLHILSRRAEGAKYREIVEELKQMGTPRNRHSVRYIIRRYEKRWGIRYWKPEQLTDHRSKK